MGPDFICIGAQKAGTAWLSQCLQVHPNLWNPGIKELHFFDGASFSDNEKKIYSASLSKRRLKKIKRKIKAEKLKITSELSQKIIKSQRITFEDYLELFSLAPNASKTWEITPSYGSMGLNKLAKMNELLPHTKYLYILRDPVNRALSSLRMSLERRSKRGESESMIIDRWLKMQLDRGRYSRHIPIMNQILSSKEKIIYLPFGLVKSDPQKFMRRIEEHLGIPQGDYNELLSKPYHQTSKSVTIPAETKEHIERELRSEKDFIARFFGSDFSSNCT